MKRFALLALILTTLAVKASEPVKEIECVFHIVTMRESDCAELKLTDLKGGRVCTPAEAAKLLDSFSTRKGVQTVTAPKLLLASAQMGFFKTGGPKEVVSSATTTVSVEKGATTNVKYSKVDLGLEVKCFPILLSDGSIYAEYTFTRICLDETVPPVPLTTFVTPVFEGGSQGVPVPFTAFVQSKSTKQQSIAQSVKLADGHTVLAFVGSQPCMQKTQNGLPFLCELPLLGELFVNEVTLPDTEYTFLLMTAKSVAAPLPSVPASFPKHVQHLMPAIPATTRERGSFESTLPAMQLTPCPPPVKNPEIVKILLEQYDVACKTGDAAKAKTIAAYCLDMDPLCFAKR